MLIYVQDFISILLHHFRESSHDLSLCTLATLRSGESLVLNIINEFNFVTHADTDCTCGCIDEDPDALVGH